MGDVAGLPSLIKAAGAYATEVGTLSAAPSTTEPTYYPAVRGLIAAALSALELPFDVRINTSEQKSGGGTNLPDVALYDADGQYLVICGEIKRPIAALEDLAASTDQKDQIGRYLAATNAVLISNVRAFGLVTVSPDWSGDGPVPPEARRLEYVVELWPSVAALKKSDAIKADSIAAFAELIETAATRYAPIAEPESLARIMARQAKRAKADLPETFTNAVQSLLDDFGKALGVGFEGPEGEEFLRSSLIQTAFYGLFAAWALWWQGNRKSAFRWEDLADYLKIPFLGSLFHEFRHPTRIKELRLAQHLDIATETLGRVDGEQFFKRFRLPSLKHDAEAAETAILHFYEPFLQAFDPDLRKELGVWYTPNSIVRYQVGKIDQLLRSELGCERGFADENVVVLDPACGTGAYLIEVLRYAAAQLENEGVGATLGARLLDAVCKRFIGFEILTAPFVVAQLQMYLLLSRLGATPDEKHRPAIFLTNSLTGWNGTDQLKLHFPELQEEHDAARVVKRDAKVIVILGNPPYNRFAGVPLAEEADLVDHYKGITRDSKGKQVGLSELFTRWGVRKHLLNDLYIRFFRLADTRIGEKAQFGIVSFISNSSYLAGRSHPIMRQSILGHFDAVWIDNLHGNRIASERTPSGQSCETIFNTGEIGPGIKVGTCISTFLKRKAPEARPGTLFLRDFWGRADKKREALLASLDWNTWPDSKKAAAAQLPEGPREYQQHVASAHSAWKFVPTASAGYEEWIGYDELFPRTFQGVNPNRGLEGSVIDSDRGALEKRMTDYFSSMPFDQLKSQYPELCEKRARFEPIKTREKLRAIGGMDPSKVQTYVLFPLDRRWIYYEADAKFLNEARSDLGDHMAGNELLVCVPQARRPSESRALMATSLFDLHLYDWGAIGFPAVVAPEKKEDDFFAAESHELLPRANLAIGVWEGFRIGWSLKGGITGSEAKRLCKDLFRYCIAIAHSPQYGIDHKDSLAHDWPRVPIVKDRKAFMQTVSLGDKLAQLLDPTTDVSKLLKSILGKDSMSLGVPFKIGGGNVLEDDLIVAVSYFGSASGRWEVRPRTESEAHREQWGASTGDLYLSKNVALLNVPQAVWHYELGGYPVIKKWLGYRQANRRNEKPLSLNELDDLRGIILRIAAVLTFLPALDEAYQLASAHSWQFSDFSVS